MPQRAIAVSTQVESHETSQQNGSPPEAGSHTSGTAGDVRTTGGRVDFGTGTVSIRTRCGDFATKREEGVGRHDRTTGEAGTVVPVLIHGDLNVTGFIDLEGERHEVRLASRG